MYFHVWSVWTSPMVQVLQQTDACTDKGERGTQSAIGTGQRAIEENIYVAKWYSFSINEICEGDSEWYNTVWW